MEAFIEHEVPQGLGKKSIIIIPLPKDGISLIVSIPYDLRATWLEEELGVCGPNDGYKTIELPNDLATLILLFHENGGDDLDAGITKRLQELANEHRQKRSSLK